jgi:hypothetical protein
MNAAEDHRANSAWHFHTQSVLSQLRGDLTGAVKAWERFSAHNGDIGYFADSPAPIHHLLSAIREKFEELEDLQAKLGPLEKACEVSAKAVSENSTGFPSTLVCRVSC